jgi:hypothetical protein
MKRPTEELENPSERCGGVYTWNSREGKTIQKFVVKKSIEKIRSVSGEGMDAVQEMDVEETSAGSAKRKGSVLLAPCNKTRGRKEQVGGRHLSKQIPIVPRRNFDQDYSPEVVDLSGGGGGSVYESIRQYVSRNGSEDPACQIMHVPSPERSSKKAETAHEEVGGEVEGVEQVEHVRTRERVQEILGEMQSQRRKKKNGHTFGEGIPQTMHDAWPRDPSAGDWSVVHCIKKCPNFLYASLVIEILVGFRFEYGKEPSMEEVHGLFMVVCSNARFGSNYARLRETIALVLMLAGAVDPQATDIDALTAAYHNRKRCILAEGKHWYFLVRMRPELSRFLARRAIRAMRAAGWEWESMDYLKQQLLGTKTASCVYQHRGGVFVFCLHRHPLPPACVLCLVPYPGLPRGKKMRPS